jgi:phosphatidylglycerol:prolipoprotein diacylglycerol transferase
VRAARAYVHIDDLELGPLPLHPFGVLVAAGVLVGTTLASRRAKFLGYDLKDVDSFVKAMLIGGFVGGHVLDTILYHPYDLVTAPWTLLFLWAGLSSFGGFVGAFVGVLFWKYFEPMPWLRLGRRFEVARYVRRQSSRAILPYCDLILAVFPVAWAFGRLGCTIVHDHPGLRTSATNLLAVAYGPGPVQSFGSFELRYGTTPRFDLGLLEFLFAVILAGMCAAAWKRKLPVGFYVAIVPLIYAPVRFALDYLRVEDAEGGDLRYAALTPAQWGCIALFALGCLVARQLISERVRRPSTMA